MIKLEESCIKKNMYEKIYDVFKNTKNNLNN